MSTFFLSFVYIHCTGPTLDYRIELWLLLVKWNEHEIKCSFFSLMFPCLSSKCQIIGANLVVKNKMLSHWNTIHKLGLNSEDRLSWVELLACWWWLHWWKSQQHCNWLSYLSQCFYSSFIYLIFNAFRKGNIIEPLSSFWHSNGDYIVGKKW